MPSAGHTTTSGPAPDLTQYDIITVNLSGGKDGLIALHLVMEEARRQGVADRVWTFHATLGLLEWPSVHFDGRAFPSVSQLAAQQSTAFGVAAGQHLERSKTTKGPDGVERPQSLLAYTAAYGRFMRLGTRYCTKSFKEQQEEAAFTPVITGLRAVLGRPVRRLKVLGTRGDESRDRAARPAYRNVLANSVRHTDEWLPAKEWTTEAVWGWHLDRGEEWHWTYDSVPGARDRRGTTRCSCEFCFLAGRRDLMLGVLRRPRLAELFALVERVRGDSFRPDLRMSDLIELAKRPGAPEPGVVIEDGTVEFRRLQAEVRLALQAPPRKAVELAAQPPRRLLPVVESR
ncbi:phosphoadenosine phosphosulfate reductase [Kitasatospora sp. NPDC093679]|uniref:phosphoadenosine phosphosulfate reductase n=1 Tax=Kitasatospora sp. NPDC093679 TaxID=3154983 RepID=UPI00342C559C